jgi:hypothetical protein
MSDLYHKLLRRMPQFSEALPANQFPFKIYDIFYARAEQASRLVFFQHDAFAIHVNFYGVSLFDTERSPQFDRKNNSAQLVDFSNDTGSFQDFPLLWI